MASPQPKPLPPESTPSDEAITASTSSGGEVAEPTGFRVTAPDKPESFPKALIHVILATAIFAGLLWLYNQKVERDEMVRDLGLQAKDLYLRDGTGSLLDAEAKLDEGLALDDSHEFSLALKGLLNAQLWVDHGLTERRDVAESFTKKAEATDAPIQERFGARGLLMVGEGKYGEAQKYLVDLIEKGGQGPAIFGALGLALRGLGNPEEARNYLKRAADSEWKSPRYNYWMAQLYFEEGDYQNAATFAKRALDANGDHLLSLVLRSRVQISRREDVDQAKETLEDVLSRPESRLTRRVKAQALVGRSELLKYEHKPEEALAVADEAITLMPELADAHIAKGVALAAAEKTGAFEAINEGLGKFQYLPRGYHDGARALLEGGRSEEALHLMNQWGEKLPKTDDYHIAFGNLLYQQDKKDEAFGHYEEARNINGRNAEAYYRMGVVYKDKGELDKAIDQFNGAVRAKDRYPEVYEAMGWIYMEQGHTGDALRQFLEAFKYYKMAGMHRDQLNELREKIGEALKKDRKTRSLVEPWLEESKGLVQ